MEEEEQKKTYPKRMQNGATRKAAPSTHQAEAAAQAKKKTPEQQLKTNQTAPPEKGKPYHSATPTSSERIVSSAPGNEGEPPHEPLTCRSRSQSPKQDPRGRNETCRNFQTELEECIKEANHPHIRQKGKNAIRIEPRNRKANEKPIWETASPTRKTSGGQADGEEK